MAQATSKIKIEVINALAELETLGWKWESAGEDEIKCKCPVHDDANPSVNFNVKKNLWKCHSANCGAAGDIVSFIAHVMQVERSTALEGLSKRYDLGVTKTISLAAVEKWHSRIWSENPLIKLLYDRAVSNDDIRKYRLGLDEGRVTIPIFDEQGRVINVRKYMPGAPGPQKMRNTKTYSGIDLFPIEQLKYPMIWICGGEMKAIVAARFLNPKGIGALCVTAGEGAWKPELNIKFRGKHVFICMDIDPGGRAASRKVAAQVCFEAESVRIIRIPLSPDKYPKGDINDWVANEGASVDDFENAMRDAERFALDESELDEVEGEVSEVRLVDSTKTENMGRRIAVDAVVSAMDETPYLVPKEIGISCTKDQPNCPFCPVKPIDPDEKTGKVTLTIKGVAAGILDMVNQPKDVQEEAIKLALRIPPCKVVTFTVRSHYNVMDVRLIPQIQDSGDNTDHVLQAAYIVSDNGRAVNLNTAYALTGRVYPHPKTQQAVLLFNDVKQSEDSLAAFTPSEEHLKPLLQFRPDEWSVSSIQEKLDERYTDLSVNVTRIFYRPELHLAVDLTFHSCLYFPFDGQQHNGWVSVLVIGDSSQGKSETTMQLMSHYKLGIRYDCKNASTPGLLGGVQDMGRRMFISWGVITNNDRRLVVLEEIKGAKPEVITSLTDMRSSGIAEITKIEKRKAHARTRTIWVSNPRSDREVSAYNFGIETIKELMGTMEDVRRFDMAVILSKEQINPAEINRLSTSRPHVDHIYKSDLCRLCILWAWTREASQIRFEEESIQTCLQLATELCNKFTESLPLCDRGTMRYKLARLSISLAAMTFSTEVEDPNVILVRKCHVEYVAKFLNSLYSSSVFGYEDYSRAKIFAASILDPPIVRRKILGTKHPKDFVDHLLHSDEITMTDICDWCEVDRDLGQQELSFLVRKHALYRVKRWYVKTAEFIELLKAMKKEKISNTGEADIQKEEF